MKQTGARMIWEVLVREGVDTVFGYPGGAILPAYDAMLGYPIRHVLVRHEQGAAHMADGYARASGRLGVCIATSGPGATNLVTGIATAMMDSSPIVCITGQVPGALLGRDAFQETDITGITLPITKHNYLVTRAEDVAPALAEACALARSGRPGPVLVDITKDAQQGETDGRLPDAAELPGARPTPSTQDLARAAALIDAAERPVVLAGQGIVRAGATSALAALVERSEMPVAMTLLGLGALPASHPLALGMMGMHGEAWVNTAIQEADLLVALGMRFDDRVTGALKTYAPHARKIHVDHDAAELGKNVAVDAGILGDVGEVMGRLEPLAAWRERPAWRQRVERLRGDAAARDIQSRPDDGRLYAPHAIAGLRQLVADDAIVVTDVGQHQMWQAQYWGHQMPGTLITSGGLGTMGFALPAAIGARLARPEAEIWVIAGDGGFQMTAAELSTCAQEGLDLNVAIINNGYLGMVRQWQEFFYDQRYAATPILNPDFVRLAEAHGLTGLRVRTRDEIPDAVARSRAERGTVVVEIQVEAIDSVYPMVPAGAPLHDMIRRPEQAVTAEASRP